MMEKEVNLRLPLGMKDLLPGEAGFKRELESIMVKKFIKWGYYEIVTPVLEYYDNLVPAETPADQFFKLIDREGQILAMRTEMTTPIARVVASRLAEEIVPLRLFYVANVFRHESPQIGRQREFYQAGVELIGEKGPGADAEVIALAAECLRESGLENFQINIGQVKFVRGIIGELPLEEEIKKRIVRAIARKDLVGLEMLLERNRINDRMKELVLTLPSLRGDDTILSEAASLTQGWAAREALEELKEVFHLLQVYGAKKAVFVDFSIMRDFDYYTGIVFEGYSPGIGAPICGGGRYDRLLAQYGLPSPATGFAIGLERLMLALEEQGKTDKLQAVDYLIVTQDRAKAIAKAQELRRQGFSVLVSSGQKAFSPVAKNIIEVESGVEKE